MKKLIAVLAGIVAFFLAIGMFKVHMDRRIAENKEGVRDLRTYERFWSSETQRLVIDEKSLPIFGSSELVCLSNYEDNIGSFLNGDEMNLVTMGGGNFQSLSHTMELGTIAPYVSSGKVALFLSPQWFSENGCNAEAFAARLSEDELLEFLANDKISAENKEYVLNRAESLLQNSPTQYARVQRYHEAMGKPVSMNALYTQIMQVFWKYRDEFGVYRQLNKINRNLPYYDLSAIDYDEVLELAEQQGRENCTNNPFGIYDSYWDTYVKEKYEQGEVLEKTQCYTSSPEYDDLRCFLRVADELDIEVIMVSIPVNGRWYKYRGDLCDEYYQNIRDIAAEYPGVTLIDMSIYENEPYFLKDIMHLGWKGWTRINEALYTEFVGK